MARQPSFPLIDRVIGGTLADELTSRRERGDSFADIARWLYSEHDITVSIDTVRRWCAPTPDEAAV